MTKFLPALAAACFALSAATSFAQTPPSGEHARPTPEQREKMHANFKAAREACKSASDRGACMADKMCATAPDKGKCQARFKERSQKMGQRMEQHQEIAEACTGKRGDALMQCYHAEAEKRGLKRGHEHHDKKG